MKKNLYPYNRIKNAVYAAAYGIGLSIPISLVAFILLLYYVPNQSWISILALIGVFILTTAIIVSICTLIVRREKSKHSKRYIKLTVSQSNLEELFEKKQPIKVSDNSFVYVFQERMLNTISVYHLDEHTVFEDLKPLRKVVNKFLKDNYVAARVTVNHKRHHELKVQLYVTEKFNGELVAHLANGGEQMNNIGFLRCYWCEDTRSIWIPFYKGENMDFHAAKNYHNAYKKLLQLFDCVECCEEDYDKNINKAT